MFLRQFGHIVQQHYDEEISILLVNPSVEIKRGGWLSRKLRTLKKIYQKDSKDIQEIQENTFVQRKLFKVHKSIKKS